ncbi:hypothetical protein PRIPAC_75586 [Pristionchus pacificus]|uniref:Uncharacterized protein n=1 Tax=Pristionchus pacificus TaxID=54126 RepID=A0A2A6CFN1_PRIPA|nr:hypothetical protein PRIPAC_75586 [Pristionchus pacificus]|eukprot:PDM76939.1 hypothetical protein PRIPAC_42334 [Pristionchus pacificus]
MDRYCLPEMIDSAFTDIARTYGIIIDDYDDNFVPHKELLKYYSTPKKEQAELIKELKKVEKRELLKLNDEDREAWGFLSNKREAKLMGKLMREAEENEEISKMSLEERKKRTAAKYERYMRYWAGDKEIIYEEIIKSLGIDQEAYERGDIDLWGDPIAKKEL